MIDAMGYGSWWKGLAPGYSLAGTVAGAVVLVFFYGLYSGCETGLYRVNRLRLHLAFRKRNRRAVVLDRLLDDPQVLISIFVVGANVCGYLIASMIALYLSRQGYSTGQIELWNTLILTPVFAVFCETVPKNCYFFRANTLMMRSANFIRISYFLARMTGVAFLLRAFAQLVLRIARFFGRTAAVTSPDPDDLGTLLRESLAASPFSEIQGGIAERLLSLPEIPLSRVTIPLRRIVAFPMDISRADFIGELRKHPFSRVPLFDRDPRNIVGIVSVYQVLTSDPPRPPWDFLRPVPKVSADHRLLDTLNVLREHSTRMAVVVDRSGSAIGIVTIRDLLEEVFGDLD